MTKNAHEIRVLIADTESLFRCSLRQSIEGVMGTAVVGEAADADTASKLTKLLTPDLVFLDAELIQQFQPPGLTGRRHPWIGVRTVVTATAIGEREIIEALRFGARGILSKQAVPRIWAKSIRQVMSGRYCFDHDGIDLLVNALRQSSLQYSALPRNSADYGLTTRELSIIAMVLNGYSNKEVGEECRICERTVKHHLTSIFNKVGVSSRLELALFAMHHQLIETKRKTDLSDETAQPKEAVAL